MSTPACLTMPPNSVEDLERQSGGTVMLGGFSPLRNSLLNKAENIQLNEYKQEAMTWRREMKIA